MLKILKHSLLIVIVVCLHLPLNLIAQDGFNGNLVTVSWLEKNLKNTDIVLLDASPAQIYMKKHIPGAINYDIFTYGVQELPVAEIEKRYQSWGISPEKKIVMYDQGGTYMATRLFFSLEYYGFPVNELFILDGGLAKWEEAGLPVTKDATPSPTKGTFKINKINDDIKATLTEFLNASGDTRNNVLVDALDAGWHFGGQQFFDRPGHVPNAILMPSADFFKADKTFKSPEELIKMVNYFGLTPEQNFYTHCGGGIAASGPYFALKFIIGYPKVKLHSGSQLEWVSDKRELPLWTYDAPHLMRNIDWLKSWGGKMFRMYGISQVSMVDVRPAQEFYQGHLPFSLNIPVDEFKNNMNAPEKLSKILGPAGVDATHEAVIISGAGLTKESALAYVLLEKLGQKKVSIFIDPLEKGKETGNALTKDTTSVGPKTGANFLSIPPTTYPVSFRKDVIIKDSKSTEGQYPKLFIASGKNISGKIKDGKVVHVPYTELVKDNGIPKKANEIWDILSKAGVSRYAEIICFSDDPGEAAVNYFILKLMGFPDIKVLIM